MIDAALKIAPDIVALVCMVGVLAAAWAAAATRTLFAAGMYAAAIGASAAIAALALRAPYAALAFAAIGAGAAPILLLGVTLLTSRAAKARRAPRAIATPLAACAVIGAAAWFARDLLALPPAMHAPQSPDAIGLWIGALLFAAGIGAFALLAFGERGAFHDQFDEGGER
ncbi:MAG: hypothetical protein ABW199_00110 [Caulobacterales bacterium]